MPDFFHLYNAFTPLDENTLDLLAKLAPDYRLSLPIEAVAVPDVVPVPQAEMVKNGVVGIYTTTEAVMKDSLRGHLPMNLDMAADLWLMRRTRL